MKNRSWILPAMMAGLLAWPGSLAAHHGGAAYDVQTMTTFTAVVTSFDWRNPHALLHFSVTDEKGTTGQAPSSQRNAAPDTEAPNGAQKPVEQKGSKAQPAPKDQQSTNGKSAPAKSTTGQGNAEKSPQSGMSDQNSSSQPPAASEQNERRRQ